MNLSDLHGDQPLPDDDKFEEEGDDWRIVKQAVLEDDAVVINYMDDGAAKWYRVEFYDQLGPDAQQTQEPVDVQMFDELLRIVAPFKQSIIADAMSSCDMALNWLSKLGDEIKVGGSRHKPRQGFVRASQAIAEVEEEKQKIASGNLALALDRILT